MINKKESVYEAFKARGIDFISEPQFFSCLYRSESTDRFILKISHLVSDAAGVKDIAAILSAIYNRLEYEPDYHPNSNPSKSRGFWQIAKYVPWYVYPRIFLNYLHEMITYGTAVEDDFESTLAHVVGMINKRKSSWLGLSTFVSTYIGIWPLPFSLLNILIKKGIESKASSPNSFDWFTNMGEIPMECVGFGGKATSAWLLPPGCNFPNLFYGCSGYDGTLS